MSREQRLRKKYRRAVADIDAYRERFNRSMEKFDRRVKADRHMGHLWLDEYRTPNKARTAAPIHNGRKPR